MKIFKSVQQILMGSICLAMLSSTQADTTSDTITGTMMSAEGESVGDIYITATHDGVLIRAELSGMEPGVHGFHLHETGSCDASDGFKSAGGHIAGDASHGLLSDQPTHPGDMPNIHVPESGNLTVEVVNTRISISPDDSERSALLDEDGAALLVHMDADDYQSGPAGDAGKRIACAEFLPN